MQLTIELNKKTIKGLEILKQLMNCKNIGNVLNKIIDPFVQITSPYILKYSKGQISKEELELALLTQMAQFNAQALKEYQVMSSKKAKAKKKGNNSKITKKDAVDIAMKQMIDEGIYDPKTGKFH